MKTLVFLLILNISSILCAQKNSRQEYIRQYYSIAIKEMQTYKIPASITMAQGILESSDGNGYLAKEGNNHFGIKCHEWTGPTIHKDDDKRNECFRKYFEAEDSYKDHSIFLATRTRYASLFDLDITNYKGWAKGLKKAGYATDPHYPDKLIKIIEDNQLYLLDQYAISKHPENEKLPPAINSRPKAITSHSVDTKKEQPKKTAKQKKEKSHKLPTGHLTSDNGVPYIIAQGNLTYAQIANKNDLQEWEVYKYNDLDRSLKTPQKGERIYLDHKQNKIRSGKMTHTVLIGETMQEISQQYAIKLKALYKINQMDKGTQAVPGTVLKLNKKAQ